MVHLFGHASSVHDVLGSPDALSGPSSAQCALHSPTDKEQEGSEERTSCLYCLSRRVFLGSLDHDGEEVFDAV